MSGQTSFFADDEPTQAEPVARGYDAAATYRLEQEAAPSQWARHYHLPTRRAEYVRKRAGYAKISVMGAVSDMDACILQVDEWMNEPDPQRWAKDRITSAYIDALMAGDDVAELEALLRAKEGTAWGEVANVEFTLAKCREVADYLTTSAPHAKM